MMLMYFAGALVLIILLVYILSAVGHKQDINNNEIRTEQELLRKDKSELIEEILELEAQLNQKGQVDEETFYDVLNFLMNHQIITVTEYTDIQTKSLPYL